MDLVAERLLALAKERPDAFRRAIVVVPTAESGRWLRERVAEMATEGAGRFKPVLMPEIMLMGQLIPDGGKGVAREEDTLAAWLQALGEQDESSLDEFAPLIPRRPQTHVALARGRSAQTHHAAHQTGAVRGDRRRRL